MNLRKNNNKFKFLKKYYINFIFYYILMNINFLCEI